jgi:hypothetical protein
MKRFSTILVCVTVGCLVIYSCSNDEFPETQVSNENVIPEEMLNSVKAWYEKANNEHGFLSIKKKRPKVLHPQWDKALLKKRTDDGYVEIITPLKEFSLSNSNVRIVRGIVFKMKPNNDVVDGKIIEIFSYSNSDIIDSERILYMYDMPASLTGAVITYTIKYRRVGSTVFSKGYRLENESARVIRFSKKGSGAGIARMKELVCWDYYYVSCTDYGVCDYEWLRRECIDVNNDSGENWGGGDTPPGGDGENSGGGGSGVVVGFNNETLEQVVNKWEDERINGDNLKPCINQVLHEVQALSEGAVGMIINKFCSDIPGYNWILKHGTLPANSYGQTYNYDAVTKTVTTIIDANKFNLASDLAVAQTLIHECLHAYLVTYFYHDQILAKAEYPVLVETYFKAKRPDLNAAHHDQMVATLVNDIAIALKEYGQNQGYNIADQYYKDLAWGGLESTKAYKNVTTLYDQQRINTVISTELAGIDYNGNLSTQKGKPSGCTQQ